MKSLALLICLWSVPSFSQSINHCKKFEGKGMIEKIMKSLSNKLFYEHKDFCQSPRISDIYNETKLVYHPSDDRYHPYEFITIHYFEYSCEYQYNLDERKWADQYCYSTW